MIEVRSLTKDFGSTRAVDDLTFTVHPGRVTGFLGPNGAGKSTTMRMILGLDRPTSGTATVAGSTYGKLKDPLRTVGALLDAKWVHPNRSARAHLRWMAAANGIAAGRVDEVLELVGLADVAGRPAGKFSLGMSQRLGLAAAMLGDPPILLFDEPLNGLDPEGIHWIRTFMQSLAAQGRTVFVSSHLLAEMAQAAQHLVVIGQGRLIADTSAADFVARFSEMTVRVRSPQLDALREVLVARGMAVRDEIGRDEPQRRALIVTGVPSDAIGLIAAEYHIPLLELSPLQASLEEAFMRMTEGSVQYRTEIPAATAHGANGGPR